MIPSFDQILPTGIHNTTLREFVDTFCIGPKRMDLYHVLNEWYNEIISKFRKEDVKCIYIDGSFVTKVDLIPGNSDRPRDIDVLVEVSSEDVFETKVLDCTQVFKNRIDVKYTYQGDLFRDFYLNLFENVSFKDENNFPGQLKKGFIKIIDWSNS